MYAKLNENPTGDMPINKEIFNNVLDYAINLYINDGEDKDDMISHFEGKLPLVHFLRNRAFEREKKISEQIQITEPIKPVNTELKETTKIAEPIKEIITPPKPMKQPIPKKNIIKKPKQIPKQNSDTLF